MQSYTAHLNISSLLIVTTEQNHPLDHALRILLTVFLQRGDSGLLHDIVNIDSKSNGSKNSRRWLENNQETKQHQGQIFQTLRYWLRTSRSVKDLEN